MKELVSRRCRLSTFSNVAAGDSLSNRFLDAREKKPEHSVRVNIGRLSLFLPLWSDARAIDLNFVAANRNAEQTLVERADFAADPL